ncbi:uncharacterized protein METZ01_LOCUS397876, partial [marine metagenome]
MVWLLIVLSLHNSPLTEPEPLDLSSTCLRQPVHKFNLTRILVR